MRLSNLGAVGITGIIAVFAGLYLIWRHRSDIFGWIATYVSEFRAELEMRGSLVEPDKRELGGKVNLLRAHLPHGALAIVAGVSLIIAGQLALYIDLLS